MKPRHRASRPVDSPPLVVAPRPAERTVEHVVGSPLGLDFVDYPTSWDTSRIDRLYPS